MYAYWILNIKFKKNLKEETGNRIILRHAKCKWWIILKYKKQTNNTNFYYVRRQQPSGKKFHKNLFVKFWKWF